MTHINPTSTRRIIFSTACALALVISACDQPEVDVSSEYVTNAGVAEAGGYTSVTVGSQGRFRVLWSSVHEPGPVHTRGYGVDGLPLSPNTVTHPMHQHGPQAGMDDAGRTVVVVHSADTSYDSEGIRVLRLDEQGQALGAPIVVTPAPQQDEIAISPALSVASDGSFVVTWNHHPDGCHVPNQLYLQSYDASGTPRGGAVLVHESEGDYLVGTSKVEQRSDGTVLVAWSEYEVVSRSDSGCGVEPVAVYGRWIGADGVALAPAFHIMDTTDGVLSTGTDGQGRMYVFALQGQLSFEDSQGQLVLRMIAPGSKAPEPAVILRDDILLPHIPTVAVGASGLVAVLNRSVSGSRVKLSLMRWRHDDPTPLVIPVINPRTNPSSYAALGVGPEDHIVAAWPAGGALMDNPSPEKFSELYIQKIAPNGDVMGELAWQQ